MAMPKRAQRKSRIRSGLSILIFTGFIKNNIQNKITETPIRTTFKPNACTSPLLVRCFTAERFIAKKIFVKISAICAKLFLFK